MKVFETMVDEAQAELQDDGTTYTDTFVAIQLEDALREISDYSSYEMMEVFKIESRTGTADEDKSSALVDDTKTQFVDVIDIGKEVYNTTDKTRAVVTAFVDTGELTLSKDIFPDGDETYEIFNEGCSNKYQIYIGDVTDYVGNNHGVFAVEHPFGTRRNFTIEGNILTIKVDSVEDSGGTAPDVEVYVWFNKRHRVSQLSDLAGAIDLDAGYVAGSTTINVDELGSTEIVAEDTLLTIAGIRGIYRVTTSVVTSANEAELVIWPGLESAATLDDVVTIIGSTLNTTLERLVVELCAARCGMSVTADGIPKGGAGTYSRYETKLAIVLGKLETLMRQRPPRTKHSYSTD